MSLREDITRYAIACERQISIPLCDHYVDNQGFCHACGKPLDFDNWMAYEHTSRWAAPSDSDLRQWSNLQRNWRTRNGY